MTNILSLLFLQRTRAPLCLFLAALLAVAGAAHMVKLNFTTEQFQESWREYLLHCAAGLLFGWLFVEALFGYAHRWLGDLRRNWLPGYGLALLAPLLFVVLMHQTRYFLNDGPATLAMAAGVLLAGLLKGKSSVPDIAIPESFLTLIEAGRMDADFSIGIVNSLGSMDHYSPRLYAVLALIHRRQGNGVKAAFAEQVAAQLQNERREK